MIILCDGENMMDLGGKVEPLFVSRRQRFDESLVSTITHFTLNQTTTTWCSKLTNFLSICFPGGARVYDVTKYLDDHPGGAEVMLDLSGQNADEFFEDIGHSQDARTELEKYLIGIHKMTEEEIEAMRIQAENKANKGGSSPIVFLLIAIAAIIYAYFQEVSNSSIHSWS